jgi:penicillin amidase
LLTDALPGAGGRPLSLRLLLHESTRDMQAFLVLGRAREAADFERAAVEYGAPAQNLVYATAAKEAGYVFFGRVPRRDAGPTPALPRDGTKSAGDWDGFLPGAALPRFRLKDDGFLVTANQPTVGPGFPHYLSHLYEPGYRAARITELLKGRRELTADDLAAIQLDAVSLGAEAFRRDVLLPSAEAIRRTRPPAVAMLDRLLASSGDEGVDAVGPALLHLVYFHLARRVFGVHLGEDLVLRWMGAMNLMDEPLLRAFRDPQSPWVKPAVRETFLGEALEDAAKDLAAAGHAIDVPWGRVHTLTLQHPLSAVPIIGPAFTLGPYPASGGPYTPSAGQYLHDRPLAMKVGASYRHVIDFADPERSSRMITYGGQSGSIGSRHYADQMPLWLEGKALPMRLSSWPETGRDLRLVRA